MALVSSRAVQHQVLSTCLLVIMLAEKARVHIFGGNYNIGCTELPLIMFNGIS